MKGIIFSVLLVIGLYISFPGNAQVLSPVRWSYGAKKINKNQAYIFLKASIDNGWHIYSTVQKDGSPVRTSFTFVTSDDYEIIGTIDEPKPVTKYESAFGMGVSYFENGVIFRQKLKLNRPSPAVVKGTLNFMVCNDQKCLPPETVRFEIPIK